MANPVNQILRSGEITPGPQIPIGVDYFQTSFAATVAVYIASGTAKYSIEFTLDDVNALGDNARWFTDPTLNRWQTASKFTQYTTPIQFVRINLDEITGQVEVKLLQGFDK